MSKGEVFDRLNWLISLSDIFVTQFLSGFDFSSNYGSPRVQCIVIGDKIQKELKSFVFKLLTLIMDVHTCNVYSLILKLKFREIFCIKNFNFNYEISLMQYTYSLRSKFKSNKNLLCSNLSF